MFAFQLPELYHWPLVDQPFNAVSHAIATVLFMYLGWKLLKRGHEHRMTVVFLAIYAFACVFLFSMSTMFHTFEKGGPTWKVMERLDHGAIFILITGTFTAVHGTLFRGWFRWLPLIVVWCVTAAAISLKMVFFESLPTWLGLSFYLGLGWGVALTAIPIFKNYGGRFLLPLFLGGIAYSGGAIMEQLELFIMVPGVIHPHELWHVAVLIGAIFHWAFVWRVAGGPEEARRKRSGGEHALASGASID